MAQLHEAVPDMVKSKRRGERPAEARQEPRPYVGQPFREMCRDIRRPVAGVLSLAGAALTEPALPGPARSCLEQIMTEAQSVAELIDESMGCRQAADARSVDLAQLARETAAAYQVTYSGTLTVAGAARPALVDADRVGVRRIIINLLSNATRAAGPDGRVKLEVSGAGMCARLAVTDTGPGFAQIASGTGLGSRVIAQCLAQCGGEITYKPTRSGGVRAVVSLPMAAANGGRSRCS